MAITGKQLDWYLLGIIIFITFAFFVKGQLDAAKIASDGAFVIGRVCKVSSGGRTGRTNYYEYYYNGHRYVTGFKDMNYSNRLVFLHILPQDPTICRQMFDVHVPPCLTIKDVPKWGWEKMPLDACN